MGKAKKLHRKHMKSIQNDEISFEFIRKSEKLENKKDWKVRASIRYYQTLCKEYAICNLSKFQQSQIGLRWRKHEEVVKGKGQFICSNEDCSLKKHLHSYEVYFKYKEHHIKKECLVKVRVCPDCAKKLFYKQLNTSAGSKLKDTNSKLEDTNNKLEDTTSKNIHERIEAVREKEQGEFRMRRKDVEEFKDLLV